MNEYLRGYNFALQAIKGSANPEELLNQVRGSLTN